MDSDTLHHVARARQEERLARSLRAHAARTAPPVRHRRSSRCPLTALAQWLASRRRATAPVAL